MKPLPEIDPEIRGLLEEIVADPRSSLRLVPRHALLSWFTSGETVRAREISATSAERHLIEAHREELARLLYDAGVIAFWKTAELMHRPLGSGGSPVDPSEKEPELRKCVTRRLTLPSPEVDILELLQRCLAGLRGSDAQALLQASLGLIPNDKTRCYVVLSLPDSDCHTAIAAFSRLLDSAHPSSLRLHILHGLGIRLAHVGRYAEARESYRLAAVLDSGQVGRCYALHLSCLMEEEAAALSEARELAKCAREMDVRVVEARAILQTWFKKDSTRKTIGATRLALRVSSAASGPAAVLCQAYES